jgi:murein L,D-transpeptidase YafK
MSKRKIIWLAVCLVLAGLMIYYFYPESKLPNAAQIDNIIVYKSRRQMLVYSNGRLLKTYSVSLGRQPVGAKEFEGDNKTPEGIYFINDKNPNSDYYKNLGVSYPNESDIENAKRFGKSAGGDIKIHGLKNKLGFIGKFHRWFDWTAGCIAVTDNEIDELYSAIKIGTPVEIKP